jgi:putative DNA primase/helicase
LSARAPADAKKKHPGNADPSGAITSRFISECIFANEHGDGRLYTAVNHRSVRYNKTSGTWLRWEGHHWGIDHNNENALRLIENIVDEYLKEAKDLVDRITAEADTGAQKKLMDYQKNIYDRAKKLRSDRGRNNALKFVQTVEGMSILTENIDNDPWSLPCQNGVIDLKTGDLRQGRPEEYMMVACPHAYLGVKHTSKLWEQIIMDIFNHDSVLVSYIQRLFGYGITGVINEHVMPVFWGQGRNGKSMIVETIRHTLGPLAGPILPEMLLDQGYFRSSGGPSPDIMALKGLRMAFASETDEGRRISSSKVKMLTGGDSLKARNPHDKYETTFQPTHKLFLMTNHKPHADANDFAFWERLHLVPFMLSFVTRVPTAENERAADPGLPAKLRAEASGILSWLVRGCLEWQQSGLDPPMLVREATQQYRADEDLVGEFIDARCMVGDGYSVKATELYTAFTDWYVENCGARVPSQKKFGTMMGKKFEKRKTPQWVYFGVRLAAF